ncbi:MAG: glycogen synthase [Chloroflexi bacterium]|nr:glycogen synthase [Chloroflexota bacterium]
MRVLFVASEASPLAKVGGLADVIGSLPAALNRLGHDVRLIIPRYGCINFSRYLPAAKSEFEVPSAKQREPASLETIAIKDNVPVYLIGNETYFGGQEVYGKNDLERFLFFSRAVFELLPRLDWQPEIVHCHDWHAALVTMWLKKAHYAGALIFTIHNLAYHGAFDAAFLAGSGLNKDWADYPRGAPEPPLNFMSQGILWADLVTTVSETYAREILTPEYGAGLDHLLRYRHQDLLGIVNGLDYAEYNPETAPYLKANYDWSTVERRSTNKLALQERAGLPPDAGIPLIGMVQRLDQQKGFDILEKALPSILEEAGVQLVILGQGREHYRDMLGRIASRYPGQVALFTAFDNALAHLIYAGCDMFLMPSRFEPCGLGQLIAMRYGALPVVRHTGGLVDTVAELSPDLARGSGFVFHDYTAEALVGAVSRGTDAFKKDKATWRTAMQRVMRLDFSWQASAAKYEAAYRRVLKPEGL